MFARFRLRIIFSVVLVLSACVWDGVKPVFERVKPADQFDRASLIIFGQVVESRSLGHKEIVPKALVRPEAKTVKCDAVEKTVDVWQVLKGPSDLGSKLRIYTYEVVGVSGLALTSNSAVLFLTRQGTLWRPVSDFGQASISLPGFPAKRLALEDFPNAPDLKIALVDVLLDPRNVKDWESFGNLLDHLIDVSYDLAEADGILARNPGFMTQHLIPLAESANRRVAAIASWQLALTTGLCNEIWFGTSDKFLDLQRKNFLAAKLYSEPGRTAADQETTYWRLKNFSCSSVPEVRQRANMLLYRYFPNRGTVGCDICVKAAEYRSLR